MASFVFGGSIRKEQLTIDRQTGNHSQLRSRTQLPKTRFKLTTTELRDPDFGQNVGDLSII